jgi:hypothetical protein
VARLTVKHKTKKKEQIMKAAAIAASVCAALVLSATVALAKRGTIGIYGIIDKVAFEPDGKSPERIRISGVFVVPVPMSSGEYKAPQRGYLYFRVAPGMEQATRQEWSALKDLAGTGRPFGFGYCWVANPADPTGNPHHSLEVHVHREGDGDVVLPEVYPQPNAKRIVMTANEPDPDFDMIAAKLR